MSGKYLNEQQRSRVGDLLSSAVLNKESPHPIDIERALLILYDLNQFGYTVVDNEVKDILRQSGRRYSDSMIELLSDMANAISSLVSALNNHGHSKARIDQAEFDSLK